MTYRCQRCDYRTDDNDEAGAHMRETGHKRCICCARSLTTAETLTCERCIANVRADLADIAFAYAMLDQVITTSSFRSMSLPGGDALVMHGDGNAAGLKPYKPSTQQPRPGIDYPAIQGRHVLHPAYTDDRPVPDGKEHYADHWASDPSSVLALLEVNERDWRATFGQPPADNLATVTGCVDYLLTHLDRAAHTHLGFDEFADDLGKLKYRLTRVAGSADVPIKAAAKCFECGAKRLVRVFRPSGSLPWERRVEAAVKRHAHLPKAEFLKAVIATLQPREGFDWEGAVDDYECSACGREYDRESYLLALRAAASDSEGWVLIAEAAVACRQPVQRVRNWADRLKIGSRCDISDRRVYVWWPDVYDRANVDAMSVTVAS